jgi:hypothetical protein
MFVQDYLQLQFDGSTMTCLVFPTVQFEGKSFNDGDLEYRNKLSEQINKTVSDIVQKDHTELDLIFDDGQVL